MADISRAPWTDQQIAALVERQFLDNYHPYTCDRHSNLRLIPTRDGWRCADRGCDYRQNWSFRRDAMASPAGEVGHG